MYLETRQIDEALVITLLLEELDISNVSSFRETVARYLEDSRRVVLRLDFVRFVDSSGLGAILSCFRRLREREAEFALSGANPEVMAVLEIVGMHKVLKVYSTIDAAISGE